MDRLTTIKAAVSAAAAALTAFWGWTGWLAAAWFLAMLLDYATGSAARSARRHMEQPLRPRGTVAQGGQRSGRAGVGAAGLRTAGCCSAVCPGLGAHYDVLLCPLVTAWYLLTELGSVVENAGALGAPLPPVSRAGDRRAARRHITARRRG